MRVAWVGPVPPHRGGVPQHAVRTIEALERCGHVVVVESWGALYPRRLFPGEQPRVEGPAFRLRWWSPLSWVRAGRRVRHADVIVIPWVTPVPAIALRVVLAASGATPAVLMAHNALPHERMPLQRGLLRLVARRCRGAVTHAAAVAAQLAELTGLDPIAVCPHPPNLPLDPTPVPAASPMRLLFFGRVRPYKGVDLALDALAERPDLHLTIAGECWEPSAAELAADIDARGLSERVALRLGYLDDELVPSLFADHHLVVAPYRDATVSGVVPLAHAAGRPVVVTPVGGLPESVADGIDGIVATGTSAEALGAAIDRALADLDELAVGAASRRLGWRAVADALTAAVD